jgi:hypothetical protein
MAGEAAVVPLCLVLSSRLERCFVAIASGACVCLLRLTERGHVLEKRVRGMICRARALHVMAESNGVFSARFARKWVC